MAGDEDRPREAGDEAAAPLGAPAPARAGAPLPVEEPSLEAATADHASAELAAADRPAEAAAAALPPRAEEPFPARRSRPVMPLVLALIGLVLIGLLAANLYGLYNPPANDALPALQASVAQLGQRLDAVEKRPPVDLGPLSTRLSALSDQVAGLKAAVDRDAGAAAAAAADAKAATEPLTARTNDLAGALDALGARVSALPKVDVAPLTARLDDLEKRLPPLEAYFAAPKSGERVTEARQNGSAAEARLAPVAVIADGIGGALAAGRPIGPEVKALAALGVDRAALAPLEAVASGAATDADLAAGFAAVQDGLVVAAAPVTTGTMLDRMMANAQSLVKVSRTGAGPGEDAGAGAARIAATLRSGDLPAAAAEWDRLPEASRARSADWAARLKARVAADGAAHALQRSAVEALAAAVPAP